MKVTVLFAYTENIIPPKCRKPREVRFDDGTIELDIREIQESDAPIAISRTDSEDHKSKGSADYRWFEGQLWTCCDVNHRLGQAFGEGPKEGEVIDARRRSYSSCRNPGEGYSFESKSKHESRLAAWAESFILINGQGWYPSSEPCYYVSRGGFGSAGYIHIEHGVSEHNLRELYFSLLQAKEAEMSVRQNMDPSETYNPMPRTKFEILLPDCIQINVAKKEKVTVFGICKQSYSKGCDFELVEAEIEVPPDAIEGNKHLEIAQRHFIENSDKPSPEIVFDERSTIGSMIVALRKKIQRLTDEKYELMGKPHGTQGTANVLEF